MSDGYALAAVTAVIRSRIRDRLVRSGVQAVTGGTDVTSLPPDRIDTTNNEPSQVNVYLYQVTRNPALANNGQPRRNQAGAAISSPSLPLDLHYLVTAYGASPYHWEILLGHAMQELHEHPVFTRDDIDAALNPAVPDPTLPAELSASGLGDQVERVRMTLGTMASEEMSRLWNSLQADYRPTASYMASVVLVDSETPGSRALPVLSIGPTAETLQLPRIRSVVDESDAAAQVGAASVVSILGDRLPAPTVRVFVGGIETLPADAHITSSRITVDLAGLAESPRAGLLGVQVIHDLPLGQPPVDHQVRHSNVAPLILHPSIAPVIAVGATAVDPEGVERNAGTITVTVDPPVWRDQAVTLTLNERDAPPDRLARSYSLAAPAANGVPDAADTTPQIVFAFAEVASGTYVTRLVVDGVDSLLTLGADGRYESPQVTMP